MTCAQSVIGEVKSIAVDVRQDRQGKVCVLRTPHIINVLGVFRAEFLHFRAVRHFVNLLVEYHFLELHCIIIHHLQLNITQIGEIVESTWLLVERIYPEDGELIIEFLTFITRQELSVQVQARIDALE